MKRLLPIGFTLLVVLFVLAGINASLGYTKVLDAVSNHSKQEQLTVSDTDDTVSEDEYSAIEPVKNLSPSQYIIDVSVTDQMARIYDDNKLVKEMTTSTGKNNSTPLGSFTIQNRGEWFFSDKYQEGAMWWVSFKDFGTYLFHSLPMDNERNIIPAEEEKLGTPASHGCIRLGPDNAKWIYDNIPEGAQVKIHQ